MTAWAQSLIRISNYEVETLQKRLAEIAERRAGAELRIAVLDAEAEGERNRARMDAEAGMMLGAYLNGWKSRKAAAEGDAVDGDYGVGGFAGLQELPNLNKPVIAAVNGICCGGGLELALSCDLILATDTATFALPEIRSGTVADAASIKLPISSSDCSPQRTATGGLKGLSGLSAELSQTTSASSRVPAGKRCRLR